jgi:hypothetical protein
MEIPAWQYALNISIYMLGLFFLVGGLRKNRVSPTFKGT